MFSWGDILKLVGGQADAVTGTRVFLITMNADLAGPNNLVKHFWAERSATHNRRVREDGGGMFVLLLDAPCQSHILNAIQVHCFRPQKLATKMYNACFALNNINKWAVVRSGLVRIVREDLSLNLFCGQAPPAGNREHNQKVLEAIYFRHRHTRSREGTPTKSKDSEITETGNMLLDILNGDWRKSRLQHWCWDAKCPCGRDLDTLVELVVPLLERAIFEPLASRTPSTSRWHTYGPAFEGGALGVLVSNVLGRAIHAAAGPLSQANVEEDKDADSLDWRELCNAKAQDTVDFFCSADSGTHLATACIVKEPLDQLSSLLQHADETGFAIPELIQDGQAVDKCLQHLFLLLQPPDHLAHTERTAWQVDMVTDHFGFSPELADALMDAVLRIASQVWSRMFSLRYIWDWRVLLLGNPWSESEAEFLDRFLGEDGCCLGPRFTERLQELGADYLKSGLCKGGSIRTS